MNCTLVHAFVSHESLDSILKKQAEQRAAKMLHRIEHTMQIEAQGGTIEERQFAYNELVEEMLRTLPRELWEEN